MGDKLWPTFKNSQCQLNRLLKVPLGSLLLHNELTENTRSTLHVLNIVVYTLHSHCDSGGGAVAVVRLFCVRSKIYRFCEAHTIGI